MGCQLSVGTTTASQLHNCLSDKQTQIVKETWDIIAEDMETTGMIIFTR